MNLEIKEIKDKKVWEDFLSLQVEKTFLQSWNWGDFQKEMGNKIWRLGVFLKKDLLALALVSKFEAKRGRFLLIQHGPVIKEKKDLVLKALLEKIKNIGQTENCSFIRIAPLLRKEEINEKLFKKMGFRKSSMHASAYQATWKLNISLDSEKLLSGMRKTTRYLIRQALKNEYISVEKSQDLNDFEIYKKLNTEVSKRQKFVPFSEKYIEKEFEIFSRERQSLWLFGKYQDEVVAGALLVFWQGTCFYHQAASSGKFPKEPLPYLIVWQAIEEAKKRGCNLFDFWGYVNLKDNPKHPWAGPTFFKMGFGGDSYEYLETKDLPLSKRYWLIYLFEKMRKIKRNL
jgi:peptidoglycan pentaglycine glycine transferase (the first glycine)